MIAALDRESRYHAADATGWALDPKAATLIDRLRLLDGLAYQAAAFDNVAEAIAQEIESVELDLENIRDEAVTEAIALLAERDQERDDLCAEIDEAAPTVAEARKAARLAEALALVPVYRLSATQVAA